MTDTRFKWIIYFSRKIHKLAKKIIGLQQQFYLNTSGKIIIVLIEKNCFNQKIGKLQ